MSFGNSTLNLYSNLNYSCFQLLIENCNSFGSNFGYCSSNYSDNIDYCSLFTNTTSTTTRIISTNRDSSITAFTTSISTNNNSNSAFTSIILHNIASIKSDFGFNDTAIKLAVSNRNKREMLFFH